MTDSTSPKRKDRVTTDMDPDGWVDISESEFVDIATGRATAKIGFVFSHPEIGLHGFEWQPDRNHLRAVSYEAMADE